MKYLLKLKTIGFHLNKLDLVNKVISGCFQPERTALRSSFQVSGSPGRHQWLQSTAITPLYPSGCASFLYCESVVTSKKYTGFLILFNTFFTTTQAIGVPAGYFSPKNGCFSLIHDFAGSFHSLPLITTSHTPPKMPHSKLQLYIVIQYT